MVRNIYMKELEKQVDVNQEGGEGDICMRDGEAKKCILAFAIVLAAPLKSFLISSTNDS